MTLQRILITYIVNINDIIIGILKTNTSTIIKL